MLTEFIAILAGLVLLTGMMSGVPAIGKFLDNLGNMLLPLKSVIGALAFLLGIWYAIDNITLLNVMLILAGLLLIAEFLNTIPAIGKFLSKAADFLAPGQAIIGVITIIVAILALL